MEFWFVINKYNGIQINDNNCIISNSLKHPLMFGFFFSGSPWSRFYVCVEGWLLCCWSVSSTDTDCYFKRKLVQSAFGTQLLLKCCFLKDSISSKCVAIGISCYRGLITLSIFFWGKKYAYWSLGLWSYEYGIIFLWNFIVFEKFGVFFFKRGI